MRIAAVFQRLASAAAVFFSPQGGVAEQARLRGVERQTLYRQADEALNAVEGSAAEQQRLQLQQRLHDCQEQLAQCQRQLRQQQCYLVLLDPDKQAEFASCGQAEGVSLPVLVRLLRPLLGEETPSVASLGRLTQQAARRASGLLDVLDKHSHPLVHQASADELYSGRKPVLMTVEPDSLCWLTARLSDKRDGQEWAKEFKRLPALEQVNPDAGEGLQKGVNLTNQERRRLKKQAIAEQLDHFHTLREGSRTLRRAQGRVSRAMKKAEQAQRREERCDRRGQAKTGGSGAACVKWRKAEQVFDDWAAQDKIWQEVKQALPLFTPDGELNSRERAEPILARACEQLHGADWDKTKRYLKQAETLTFLDRARQRLAELPLAAAVAQAAVRLEGLRRHPEWTCGTTQQAAVMRGLTLVWSVVMAKAGAPGPQAQAAAVVVQAGESGPQAQAAAAVVQAGESAQQAQAAAVVVQAEESGPQAQAAAAGVQAGESGPQAPTAAAMVQAEESGPQAQAAAAVVLAGESGPQAPTAAVVVQTGESAQQAQATAAVVQAAVRLEGLRRHPEWTRGTTQQAAVMRGLALAWSVVIAKAGEPGQQTQAAVRAILRQSWRGSSAVEGLNSVLRMQQGRHRRLSQGLLDLKRLYWNCRPLRTGLRKKQTPYARLGLRLPDMTWWKLLHLPPEQLRQHLSAQQVAA
jgi:hypothetical protein